MNAVAPTTAIPTTDPAPMPQSRLYAMSPGMLFRVLDGKHDHLVLTPLSNSGGAVADDYRIWVVVLGTVDDHRRVTPGDFFPLARDVPVLRLHVTQAMTVVGGH